MYEKYFKRIFDIVISFIGISVLLPIWVFIVILIKFDDGESVFYSDERIGLDGEIFKMHKFRSMKVNAPDIRNKDGSTFNSKDDPRLTKWGRILRETSLDETPQLINVIKGEMSILGPRPSMKSALETYKEDERDKMKVKPGISGYTQAYYRNGLNVREKRLKDAWYANNISFILDFKIFFRTIVTVLKREKIYTDS